MVNNTLGEDLNNNMVLDAGEGADSGRRPEPRYPRAAAVSPSTDDDVPWSLDRNDGGWVGFRHAGSNPTGLTSAVLWEYKDRSSGLRFPDRRRRHSATGRPCTAPANRIGDSCTADADCNNFGIWKAGDGNAATPSDVRDRLRHARTAARAIPDSAARRVHRRRADVADHRQGQPGR